MKVNDSIVGIIAALFLTMFTLCACYEESQESERASLNQEYQKIISFINTGKCNDKSECRYAGIGSKPCGGPWDYIVYPASLDTMKLQRMISEYNSHEFEYNKKWGLYSDCSVPPAPDSMECLNGKCIGYWNGTAR